MDWNNVLSGFVGSVVGAIATMGATHWAITGTVKANEQSFRRQQTDEIASIWRGLRIEIQENLAMLTNPAPRGLQMKVPFMSGFWQQARSHIHHLPIPHQENLIRAFSLVAQHNELVQYDRHALDWGMGNVNETIGNLQVQVRTAFDEALPHLNLIIDPAAR